MVPPLPNSRMVTVVCFAADAQPDRAAMLIRDDTNFIIIIISLVMII